MIFIERPFEVVKICPKCCGHTKLQTLIYQKTTAKQWRSEAKCHPGPTIKVPPFPLLNFDSDNLKLKKIMFRGY